ncbi:MAG TPA: M1 family aminopeptidase [Burkholderiales bacterium]|nr:M1 family aminopeptidase [Burkholderiales bacterium]
MSNRLADRVRSWLTGVAAAAASLACAAAEPDLVLDIRLDPASRELAATAELARPPRDFRFSPHPSLEVRGTTRLPGGALRIEYGGVLPALERGIDFRGALQAQPPMVSPEGSFLGAGSGWYPQPAPLFTYRVNVEVPAGQRALVAGRLVAERAAGASYQALFEHAHPAEGIDLMAGPYEVRERFVALAGGTRVRLRTYFFPELAPLAEGYLDDSQAYLQRYSSLIGAYPFSGFSVVASPLPSGFGMPTLTYLGAQVLRLPFIRATSLPHEVLHNWWGNGVLVETARGNWSEGLTTFMADYALREGESADAAREMRLGWLRDLAALDPSAARPLASFRSRQHGADAVVGYGKSAMLFFMLRDAIGEQAFSRGIRRFWEQNRYRTASWRELRRVFEQEAGLSLERFFAQWLERPGAPEVRIASARHDGRLKLEIVQEAPPYVLRLPVEVLAENRSEIQWIEISQERESLTLDVGQRPRAVRLDPDLRVYRLLDPGELPPILRQWILARSPEVMVVTQGLEEAPALAHRFFESPFRVIDEAGEQPLLIVGLHEDVDAALARLGLPPRPAALAGRGTAQVWTVRGSATPVAVVSATDAASLAALERPLPHYGAQSWLVFEGSRALARGSWPPATRVVPVED